MREELYAEVAKFKSDDIAMVVKSLTTDALLSMHMNDRTESMLYFVSLFSDEQLNFIYKSLTDELMTDFYKFIKDETITSEATKEQPASNTKTVSERLEYPIDSKPSHLIFTNDGNSNNYGGRVCKENRSSKTYISKLSTERGSSFNTCQWF